MSQFQKKNCDPKIGFIFFMLNRFFFIIIIWGEMCPMMYVKYVKLFFFLYCKAAVCLAMDCFSFPISLYLENDDDLWWIRLLKLHYCCRSSIINEINLPYPAWTPWGQTWSQFALCEQGSRDLYSVPRGAGFLWRDWNVSVVSIRLKSS